MNGSWTWITHRAGWLVASFLFMVSLAVSLYVHGGHLDVYLTFRSDSLGYYQFLPKIFLDHDIEFMHWFHFQEDGKRLSIFTIGVAWLQMPFFLLGHAWAVLTDAPRSGFSAPYAMAQLVGASTYLAFSGYQLVGLLRRSYAPSITALSVILLYLGTNLFFYASFDVGMSHVYSFFLFASLLFLVERRLERTDDLFPILFLLLGALIVLVRPLNGVVLLLPFLYRATTFRQVQVRCSWFTQNPVASILGALLAFLLILPQLLYWHAVKGDWVLFAYGTKGEAFDFTAPHLLDILISHQNGWFIYTPIMLFVMGALLWQARSRGIGARTVLLVWGVTWFLYGCWWAWWLGGAYGYRGFIEYTALFLPALAALFARIGSLGHRQRTAAYVLLGLLVFLNLRLSFQYSAPWDGPDWTWARYWHEVARAFFLA